MFGRASLLVRLWKNQIMEDNGTMLDQRRGPPPPGPPRLPDGGRISRLTRLMRWNGWQSAQSTGEKMLFSGTTRSETSSAEEPLQSCARPHPAPTNGPTPSSSFPRSHAHDGFKEILLFIADSTPVLHKECFSHGRHTPGAP